jgi:hypothetical protein
VIPRSFERECIRAEGTLEALPYVIPAKAGIHE